MKTKHEILQEFKPVFFEDAPHSTGTAYEVDDVIEAMSRHAKDEAISFANWLSNTVIAGRTMTKLWDDYNAELLAHPTPIM